MIIVISYCSDNLFGCMEVKYYYKKTKKCTKFLILFNVYFVDRIKISLTPGKGKLHTLVHNTREIESHYIYIIFDFIMKIKLMKFTESLLVQMSMAIVDRQSADFADCKTNSIPLRCLLTTFTYHLMTEIGNTHTCSNVKLSIVDSRRKGFEKLPI
jgi:uncharacterized membrane protein